MWQTGLVDNSGSRTQNQRGRPRLFDEETTLDELTELFWRKGYTQTSVADLVGVSGVHKSSLYSTFGSKDELFATILHRYFEQRMEMFSLLIETAGPGIEGIHAFLDLILSDVLAGNGKNGCLLVNSSTELGGSAPGFDDFGDQFRDAMRARFRSLIAQGDPIDHNEPTTDQRTELLLMFMIGLISTTRGGASESELRRAIDSMHATVDTWG